MAEDACENIFADKIIEILAMDLKREELNVLKNMIFAFSNNSSNKMALLRQLEQKVPETLMRKMKMVKNVKATKMD